MILIGKVGEFQKDSHLEGLELIHDQHGLLCVEPGLETWNLAEDSFVDAPFALATDHREV